MKKSFARTNKVLFLFCGLAALGLVSLPDGAWAAAGDLYVSQPLGVVQIGANGTQTTLPSVPTPTGTAVDQAGNLYVADTTTQSVVKIAPDGTQTTVATGLNNPQGLALDSSGNLYVANSGTNSILKVDPNGTKTTFAAGLNGPQGLAVDSTGSLFASNSGNGTIVKIAPGGTQSAFVSTGLNSPDGLAFDGSGNLLVADTGSNSVLKVAPNGATTALVSSGLSSPKDVAVDALGNVLVADAGSNSIKKITPGGMVSTVASNLTAPNSIAIASSVHQLLNISTRGYVQPGEHALIGGFVVRGDAGADLGQTTVVVRAIGPSLSSAGISDPLLDPTLELHDSTGALIASNDNWMDTQKSQIQASGLAPSDSREAAIQATLPDGAYTVIVSGVGGTSGVALVEAYKIQQTP